VLRTRRPLLALLLLGVLLAAGYLVSAIRSDGSAPSGSGPVATVSAGPSGSVATAAPNRSGSAGSSGSVAAPSRGADGLATVRSADLPPQARQVLGLIDAGGPFPYPQDGTVFGNVERLLPAHPRGWYREFTVPTPGSSDRGARRIVVGKDGARYYTADHYESFARIEDP
jgi:ribonuclease T1